MNEKEAMRNRRRLPSPVFRLPALILLLVSMACAARYHPVGVLGDGYSEQKLTSDRWLVTYATGAFAEPQRIARFLLRRSAEIADAEGARYFAVLSSSKGDFHPTGSQENLIENPAWAESVVEDSMEAESQARRGYARIVIQLFKDRAPSIADVYDTKEVLKRLGGPSADSRS